MIKEQVNVLIEKTKSGFEALNSAASKFLVIWDDPAPKGIGRDVLASSEKVMKSLKDLNLEFGEIECKFSDLKKEFDYFGLRMPVSDDFLRLKDKVDLTNSTWSDYSEFICEMEPFANSDWISLQSNLGKWDNFLSSWKTRIKKKSSKTSVSASILSFIDNAEAAGQSFKLLKLDHWSSDYWAELANVMSLPLALFSSLEKIKGSVIFENI
jgi:hypothetical protein